MSALSVSRCWLMYVGLGLPMQTCGSVEVQVDPLWLPQDLDRILSSLLLLIPMLLSFLQINGQKLSWTLGSIINDRDELSPPVLEYKRDLKDTDYHAIIAVSGVLILVGLIMCFVLCCFAGGSKASSVGNITVQ